ncbi:phage-related minor tail protein [Paenibacillus sp. LBL]|uniref:phage tail tape measure protein n=1 Tax=Paenibacillus sp. LBL TaxID=2940563 RepID=UPI002476D05B|nr:phage tail tape measure protein [Paenibacillus sp. LBL]MDH6674679.1 phage-related minor tail protein [Paenibacillus sp. LBL]
MAVISNLMFAVGFKVADGALRKADKQVQQMEQNWAAVGVAAGVVTAAVVGIGIAAVNAANEFNDSMKTVQMATGMTAEQMEETKAVATDLYNDNFGENWQDLGSAIASVKQITGDTGDALESTTRNALLLRDAFGYEVNESARAAKTMMENFGISSEEAFNLVAQGAQQGLDFSGELIDTINEYSLQFKALGFDANEMFDTLAAGSAEGAFNLDKVADAVKEFGIRSKDAGDTGAIEAFELLGLNADQMMRTFAAGGPAAKDAFTQITRMIGDIEDPVAQNTVAVGLFGTQFEDLQKDVITAMGYVDSQFDMTKDTMNELNDTKMNSPGEAFERIGRQMETGILKPLGDKLLPYLVGFSEWLEEAMPKITEVGGEIMDKLAVGFDAAAKAVKFLAENFDIIGPAAGIFAAVLLTSLAPALWATVAPLLPFIAVGLALAAVVTGIILVFKNWGAISTWLTTVWNAFKTWVVGLFTAIGDFFVTWGTIIWNAITSAVMNIVNTVVANWQAFSAMTQAVFNAIVGFFTSTWNSIWSTITNIANNIASFVNGVWEKIKTTATNTWEGISTGLSNMWTNVKNNFANGVNFITGLINDMIAKINSALSIKLPDWLGGKEFAINIPEIPEIPVDGSHANGLANVPFDGYVAELHEGERVLTAEENKAYSAGTGETSLAPARASSAGGATSRQEISLNINLNGSSVGPAEKSVLLAEINALFESVMRRNGLEVATD